MSQGARPDRARHRLLAGITCVFSALSYAELASTIPVCGSHGDPVLEDQVPAAVAVGWGAYLTELLDSLFGITLSDSIALPPGEGGDVNVPSAPLLLAFAGVLIAGVRESARSNAVMVITKLAVLLFFIVVASPPSTATTSRTSRRTASTASSGRRR